jgi:hypothetical protein
MSYRFSAVAAAAMLALVTVSGPAMAQSGGGGEGRQEGSPEDLAREGAERLLRALEGLLHAIPQYGMPRVEENGDIVIPRLNPPDQDENGESDGDQEGGITETEI